MLYRCGQNQSERFGATVMQDAIAGLKSLETKGYISRNKDGLQRNTTDESQFP